MTEMSPPESDGDVILLSQDGDQLTLHSSILASTGVTMSSLLRDHVQCPEHPVVMISVPGVSGAVLRSVVSLMYQGSVNIDHHTSQEIRDVLKCFGISDEALMLLRKNQDKQDQDDNEDVDNGSMEEKSKEILIEKKSSSQEKKVKVVFENKDDNKDVTSTVYDDLRDLGFEWDDNKVEKEEEDDNDEDEEDLQVSKYRVYDTDGNDVTKRRRRKRNFFTHEPSNQCPKCLKFYKTKKNALEHYRNSPCGNKNYKDKKSKLKLCPDCGASVVYLSKHRESMHGGAKWQCDKCDFATRHRDNIWYHIKVHHEGFRASCDQCEKSFSRESSLKEHIRAHHEGQRFKCDKCDFQANQKSHIIKHDRNIHLKIRHPCTICDKKYHLRQTLREHMKKAHSVDIAKYRWKKQKNT